MKNILPLILILLFTACNQEIIYDYPFQDPDLSHEERINDLVSRLSLEEKASLMLYNSPAIERLAISEYNWWNECLHGVGRAGNATVFPQAIGLAATFDEDLIFRVASAISDEARAKHNAALRIGNRGQYSGLSFWTPNINIFRDPRWGRGQETYGEDPFLTSRMGISFVNGLQGDDPRYLKAAACAKHYVVHSGPEKTRHHFNAIPSERDFRETYLPGFQALVQESGVEAIMCAYNRTYDKPCCGSEFLLNDILRKEWGFEGHIVSDCWALDDIWARHKVVEERVDAAAMAAQAGVNLNCGYIYKYLPEAVEKGLIDEKTIEKILYPLLLSRFKLGLMDPPSSVPFSDIGPEVINSEKHRSLAYEAAAKSIVLLKNNNNTLPLNKEELKTILVTGPTSMDIRSLVGNYSGYSGQMTTILEGMISKANPGTVVEHSQGFMFHNDSVFHGFWQAGRADAVLVCLGINSLYEGEDGDAMLNPNGGDRVEIELPSNQLEFVRRIKNQMKDKPLIVVINGGSAMAIPEIEKLADAVLFAWYPGEEGGNAIADIVFGDINPSGKLPVTFYKSTDDLPPFEDYSMEGRTYKYFKGEALYPFGFGLSYSEFEYEGLELKKEDENLDITITVKNTGALSGEEVVQVYARKIDPSVAQPIKKLIGFKRISLKDSEQKQIQMSIDAELLSYWNVERQEYDVEPGEYEIQLGSSSMNIKISKLVNI